MDDQNLYGLPMKVISEDNETYLLDAFRASREALDFLWEKAGKHTFLFHEMAINDQKRFDATILSPGTIILTVSQATSEDNAEAVGIVMADMLRPKWDARVHYLFWDKKQAGRHRVLLVALRWLMNELKLSRVSAEIMRYAYSALRRARKLGFLLEGRRRNGTIWRGKPVDVFLFGVLAKEITDQAIENCSIKRTSDETTWFDLLDNDYALARAMTKER